MWFWLSLIALLCWSGSDLFSKIGCQSETDKYSHLKMVTAVGVVMGLHAAYEIFIGGSPVTWEITWTYLPVSLLYISSMAMGYIGLRYIELSISSPICNSSGALVAVLCLLTGGIGELVPAQLVATALVCVGVIGLGVVEAHEDEDLRRRRQEAATAAMPSLHWLCCCPLLTACWTRRGPLPTPGCWTSCPARRWRRGCSPRRMSAPTTPPAPPTAPMS